MNIIYNFDDLDLNKINDATLGKFIRLSKLLCNDGVVRRGNFSKRSSKVLKRDLMKYLKINSESTFTDVFKILEDLSLVKRVIIEGKGIIIYINPAHCRTYNYKQNKECEDLFKTQIKEYIEEYYVYRFLDKYKNIIYVGRTNNIKNRISSHLSGGHLPNECYESVHTIEYSKLDTYPDMVIYEVYYINKYYPIYNKKDKSSLQKKTTVTLPDLKWDIFKN